MHLSNVLFSIRVLNGSIVIDVSLEHRSKQFIPIDFTDDGISICDNDEHPMNELSHIFVTE